MNIDITQIFFQLINFSVVVAALTYFLYRPVTKAFEERSRRVAEGQRAAEKAMASQSEIEQLRQNTLDEAKKKKASILKDARKQAKAQAAEILAAAQSEAVQLKENAKKDWEKELKQLRREQKQEIADLTVATYKATHGKLVDSSTAKKVIDAELASILKSL